MHTPATTPGAVRDRRAAGQTGPSMAQSGCSPAAVPRDLSAASGNSDGSHAGRDFPVHFRSSIMIAALRAFSFLAGLALLAAPSLLFLQFAHAVDELRFAAGTILLTICAGLVLGGGLLFAGLPRLAVGAQRPLTRLVTGLWILTSSVVIAHFVGFSGSVTKVASPAVLLLNVLVFAAFVWPARAFTSPSANDA